MLQQVGPENIHTPTYRVYWFDPYPFLSRNSTSIGSLFSFKTLVYETATPRNFQWPPEGEYGYFLEPRIQRAKKGMSDSPGLVDFAIRILKLKFRRTEINPANQNVFQAS